MGCISNILIKIVITLVIFPALSLAFPLYEILRLAAGVWRGFIFSVENVKGKVVLITGAASGIGEQIAYEYAKRGACLALVDINGDRLQQVSDRALRIGSPDVILVKSSVSNAQESERFVNQTVQHFGRLDHLVNNAAILKPLGLFHNVTDISTLHPIMETNFWGSIYSTHYALPYLRQSKGKIIAISSSAGIIPTPNLSIYNASKAALISLFETIRVEMGSEIGITIVTPGSIDTPMRDQYPSMVGMLRLMPSMAAEGCAKEIVESGCRGDAYLRVPYWITPLPLLKALYPEITSRLIRLFFLQQRNSRE